jgi:hypothetical protein
MSKLLVSVNNQINKELLRCSICLSESSISVNRLKLLGRVWSETYFCKHCESYFRDPLPSEEDLSFYYASMESFRYSEKIQTRMARSQTEWLQSALLKIEKEDHFNNLVEYGAGQGWFVSEALQKGLVHSAKGIEADSGAVSWGRAHLNLDLEQGFISANTPAQQKFPKGSSIVALVHVLEHLSDPLSVLKTMKQHSNCGIVFVEVPNARYEGPVFEQDTYEWSRSGEHLWSFSRIGLHELFRNAGYSHIHMEEVGDADYWRTRLRSLSVAKNYTADFEYWRKNGGGNIGLARRAAGLAAISLIAGLKNFMERSSRDQLPSIRVLAS